MGDEEEAELERQGVYEPEEIDEDALDEEELKLHRAIKDMQQMAKNESRVNKKKSMLDKGKQIKSSDNTVSGLAMDRLDKRGVDTTKMIASLETVGGRKRSRSEDDTDDMEVEDEFSSKRGRGGDGGF